MSNASIYLWLRNIFVALFCALIYFFVMPALLRAESITLGVRGSDTMAELVGQWAEAWQEKHPGTVFDIAMNGSGHAPTGLASGEAWIGAMSREMKPEEKERIVAETGFEPLRLIVAVDGLAVIVNAYNPIAALTIAELDSIFSARRECGAPMAYTHWSQLVGHAPMVRLPMLPVRRDAMSGTYEYFRKSVLCDGMYAEMPEFVHSHDVVQHVANTPGAIGYVGIGYVTPDVRVVPIASSATSPPYKPTLGNITQQVYPLGRPLHLYIRQTAGGIPLEVRRFLAFIASEEGAKITSDQGFFPLPKRVLSQQIQKLAVR